MKTVSVRIGFSAAKRLMQYNGVCANLHGYHHIVEASFTGDAKNGIVADFHELKKILGNWITKNWDHNVILNKQDKKLGNEITKVTGQKIYYLDSDPTAENIAEHLKQKICPQLFKKIKCVKIRLYDNPECFVEIE